MRKIAQKTDGLVKPGSAAPSIASDNRACARNLAHLIVDRAGSDGAPLLLVGGRLHDQNTAARIAGVREAHAERGIVLPDRHVLACGYAADNALAALNGVDFQVPGALFVNATISLEGVVRWLRRAARPVRPVRFGCFDRDPFAALIDGNVGMVRQDVGAMVAAVFARLDDPSREAGTRHISCILERLDHV